MSLRWARLHNDRLTVAINNAVGLERDSAKSWMHVNESGNILF